MYKITMKSGWVQILLECSTIFKWSEITFCKLFLFCLCLDETNSPLKPYEFKMEQIEGFRYRCRVSILLLLLEAQFNSKNGKFLNICWLLALVKSMAEQQMEKNKQTYNHFFISAQASIPCASPFALVNGERSFRKGIWCKILDKSNILIKKDFRTDWSGFDSTMTTSLGQQGISVGWKKKWERGKTC